MSEADRGKSIDTHELAVSNKIGVEALGRLLVKKGLFTTEVILAEVKEVRDDMVRKARAQVEGNWRHEGTAAPPTGWAT